MKPILLMSLFALACRPPEPESRLHTVVKSRIENDRTGACLAVAVIDQDVQHAFVCAGAVRELDRNTVFEIGSITKTMTGTVLAALVAEGKLSLDSTLASVLPAGTQVPSFHGAPILLRHLVTHTSGLPSLPSRLGTTDPNDPYAQLTEQALLDSLKDVQLEQAPGTKWAYSNFGFMLLSIVIARTSGHDFETELRERLFSPLGMKTAFLGQQSAGAKLARGHLGTGDAAAPWRVATNLAGAGGVHASLDDLVRYAEAQLGRGDAAVVALAKRSHEALTTGQPEMGFGWVRAPLSGRMTVLHDGGTGGFSSFIAIDLERRRAVVVLSDTSLGNVGGITDLGAHLLDESFPLTKPRIPAKPTEALLKSLAGRYRLFGQLDVTLSVRNQTLFAQPDGDAELELGYDSAGDFFPLGVDALLTPVDGGRTFLWTQGGEPVEAVRL